jgi:nicotinic acid mononucleotide adenylyltransferase
MTSHIVVTRPRFPIPFDHVTERVRERIVDLRGARNPGIREGGASAGIYITDAVKMDISASHIRDRASAGDVGWKNDVTDEVAKYIEKYELYK